MANCEVLNSAENAEFINGGNKSGKREFTEYVDKHADVREKINTITNNNFVEKQKLGDALYNYDLLYFHGNLHNGGYEKNLANYSALFYVNTNHSIQTNAW